VQRGEHQVAGLGGGDGQLNGLEVAQLADDDDVWVFAQRRAQGVGERAGVLARLALVDQAAARLCTYSMGSSTVMM
jgi:hypothetical protein